MAQNPCGQTRVPMDHCWFWFWFPVKTKPCISLCYVSIYNLCYPSLWSFTQTSPFIFIEPIPVLTYLAKIACRTNVRCCRRPHRLISKGDLSVLPQLRRLHLLPCCICSNPHLASMAISFRYLFACSVVGHS